jgi:circadian clock protein KaiC
MMEDKGFYKGSSILVSGTAGTGKSSLSSEFAIAACSRGEKVLYFALEESSSQIIRNMKSIGIDLAPFEKKGILKFHTMRATESGLEMHLTTIHKEIEAFKPDIVIVDPINSFVSGSNLFEARAMTLRLVDFLKMNQVTAFFTYLTRLNEETEHNFISSLIDTWILLRDIEINGERNRGIYILKSRGMNHSNQIREFLLTNEGIKLIDVYTGVDGVLTGSSRIAQEERNYEDKLVLQQAFEQRKRSLEQKRKAFIARIEAMKAEFKSEEQEMLKNINLEKEKIERFEHGRNNIAASRGKEKTLKSAKSKK